MQHYLDPINTMNIMQQKAVVNAHAEPNVLVELADIANINI